MCERLNVRWTAMSKLSQRPGNLASQFLETMVPHHQADSGGNFLTTGMQRDAS